MYISDVLEAKGGGVITIVQTETIQAAAKVLRERRFGSLVVRDSHGKVAGIITERDIIRGVAERGSAILNWRVEDLMTRDVKTCKPTQLLKDVMEMMSRRHIRHVPVVDDEGKLIGIISSTDIVRFRLNERSGEVAVLRDLNVARP